MSSSTRLECVEKTQIWQPTSAWRPPGLGGDGAAAAARCHSPPLSRSLVPHSAAGSSPLFDASVQGVKTGSISMHELLPSRLRVFGLGTWKEKRDKCTGNINTHFWGFWVLFVWCHSKDASETNAVYDHVWQMLINIPEHNLKWKLTQTQNTNSDLLIHKHRSWCVN